MKNRKLLSIVSVMLLLGILLPALIACDTTPKDPADSTTGGGDDASTVTIDLNEYKIVRPDAWEYTIAQDCLFFSDAFKELTGDKTIICNTDIVIGEYGELSDEVLDELSTKKEILLGSTNRRESARAIEGVPENSFVIELIGNKIVINSNSIDYTLEGMRYFISNYVKKSTDGTITLDKDFRYVSDEFSNMVIADGGLTSYNVVYSSLLDDEGNTVDTEVTLANAIVSTFKNALDTRIVATTDAKSVYEREILVGSTTRPEYLEFLHTLEYDEYGFGMVGNKIVVAGWNLTTTKLAVAMFTGYLKAARTENEDGTYKLEALSNLSKIYEYKAAKWEMDFPAYDGGVMCGTNASGGDDLLYYVTDTTVAEYDAYCNKLASNGYTLVSSNEYSDNKFALYKGPIYIYVYYTDYNKSVRIITSDLDTLHPEYWTANSVPSYTKIAEPTVTQISHDYSSGMWGMGYIITLEDGSFVVFDGGKSGASDHHKLYRTLTRLNKRTDGVIVISAWFLTHDHRDHYENFAQFCTTYGSNGKRVQVKAAYVNFASTVNLDNAYDGRTLLNDSSNYNQISKAVGGMDLISVRTGMKFYICNAMFEIMYTEEDIYPQKIHYFNNTSTVTRVTVEGQKLLFLGDLKEDGSDIVCGMYGKDIASDFVQVSHHGWDGATVELYQNIGAKFVFWPGSSTEFHNQYYSGNIVQAVSRYLRDRSPAKEFWNSSSTTTISLPHNVGDKVEVSG